MHKSNHASNRTKVAKKAFNIVAVGLLSLVTSGIVLAEKTVSIPKSKADLIAQGVPFDFDGDGKSDTAIFRDGEWHTNQSLAGYKAESFGLATDTPVPADYDGDLRTDIAIWRPSDVDGEPDFYLMKSSNNTLSGVSWGSVGDVPVPADYDGDGSVDFGVVRIGTDVDFFVLSKVNITAFGVVRHYRFGIAGDKPVVADYNGDGKADFAVFRPSNSTWYINYSAADFAGETFQYHTFGLSDDKLIPADYDGDGKADYAVFRESDSTWYIEQSSTGGMRRQKWGLATDKLVPADYDGDGVTDVSVYRDGQWYIWQSSTNSANFANRFGTATDVPLESLMVR